MPSASAAAVLTTCVVFSPTRTCSSSAICDVQKVQREKIKSMADSHYGNKDCAMYGNMHEMLARPDIDAMLIATGDRWHTMASITAAKAGKDVYCEKPCSMTISESRALADTFRKYDRIYQAGTQRRSIGNFLFAADLVAKRQAGQAAHGARQHASPGHQARLASPNEPLPGKDEVDWDMWLGPCPWRPFNSALRPRRLARLLRLPRRRHPGMGRPHRRPLPVGRPQGPHRAGRVRARRQRRHGHLCRRTEAGDARSTAGWGWARAASGTKATKAGSKPATAGKFAIYPESLRTERTVFNRAGTDPTTHIRNFLDCVKTRKPANANADVAAQSHVVCHAAYIAWQLARPVKFDPAKEEFIGDEEANRMRSRAMREPWRI